MDNNIKKRRVILVIKVKGNGDIVAIPKEGNGGTYEKFNR